MTRARRTAERHLTKALEQMRLDEETSRRDASILALFRAKDTVKDMSVSDIRGILKELGFPYQSDEALWQAFYRADKNAPAQ